MEQLNITVTDGVKALEVRQGQALPLKEPEKVNIAGNIQAPSNWIEVRKPNPQTDHVIFSRSEMSIIYTANESNHYATKIMGKLTLNKDLQNFGILISEDKSADKYTTEDLASFLKLNRYFFADRTEAAKIITALNQFKAKLNTEIEKNQDQRGNSKNLVEKVVESNVPTEFTLSMPVFIGYPKMNFKVEICISTTDRSVTVWLESPELMEIIISERDRIINEEIEKFTKVGLPVIER
jgi:hypothetical protein